MKHILSTKTAKEIPLWMYYVRSLIYILTGISDLFLLLFRRQLNLDMYWTTKMLRSVKNYKEK